MGATTWLCSFASCALSIAISLALSSAGIAAVSSPSPAIAALRPRVKTESPPPRERLLHVHGVRAHACMEIKKQGVKQQQGERGKQTDRQHTHTLGQNPKRTWYDVARLSRHAQST